MDACFWCLRHFETMRHFCATLYATPPGFAFIFLGRFPGFRPLRGSTAGYYMAPLRGSEFRLPSSLLRSYAEAGAGARKLFANFRFIEQPE